MPAKRAVPGRMSVQSIRQSLKGVAYGLAQRNLTKSERLQLISHQALLIDELRAVENARRKATKAKPEMPSQPEPDNPSQPKPNETVQARSAYEAQQDSRNPFKAR